MRVGHHHFSSLSVFALLFCAMAPALDAGDVPVAGLSLQERVPSTRYRLVPPRPEVIARSGGIALTSITERQRMVFRTMNERSGDGGGADVSALSAIQFYYSESSCEDEAATGFRQDCGGEACNVLTLLWTETSPANSEGVLIFVDDEQFGEQPGIPQAVLDTPGSNNLNAFNLVGIEAGEHIIRIEELNNGTLEEMTLTVYDSPPFPDSPVDINNIQCAQREVAEDGTCEMAITFGANAGASTYVVFINDEPAAEALPPGILFNRPSGEYRIRLQGSWEPPGALGNIFYLGCMTEELVCNLTCENQCNPVAAMDVCQTQYGGANGLGSVLVDWIGMESPYAVGINLRVNEMILGGQPATLPFDGDANPGGVNIGGMPTGNFSIGVQGVCAAPEGASDFTVLGINILAESPYTDPIEGAAICSYDPAEGGRTTARWTNNIPYYSLDVYVLRSGELEPEYVVTTRQRVEEVVVEGTGAGDRIVLQFFSYMEGGCYGSDRILCSEESDADDDGVLDQEDNCPNVSNSDQEDVDGDGVGNECDNCIDDANPDQADEDEDTIGDACDTPGEVDPVYFVRSICRNGSASPQLSDAVYLLNFLFTGGERPSCQVACDTDGDGRAMLTDAVQLLQFLFLGGPAPGTWEGSIPTCETYEPGIPSFKLGCEEANPACSNPGPAN